MIAEQPAKLAALAEARADYGRLASLLWTSAESPLTMGNYRREILQDARKIYLRLLSDMRDATQSIHLLYYEWASDPFTEDVGRLLAEKVKQGVAVRLLTTRWAVSPC